MEDDAAGRHVFILVELDWPQEILFSSEKDIEG